MSDHNDYHAAYRNVAGGDAASRYGQRALMNTRHLPFVCPHCGILGAHAEGVPISGSGPARCTACHLWSRFTHHPATPSATERYTVTPIT